MSDDGFQLDLFGGEVPWRHAMRPMNGKPSPLQAPEREPATITCRECGYTSPEPALRVVFEDDGWDMHYRTLQGMRGPLCPVCVAGREVERD